MRAKIAKKLKKHAFAATIKEGWDVAKMKDPVEKKDIRQLKDGKILCTYMRPHDSKRRYYRRMKKMWAGMNSQEKYDLRCMNPFMVGVQNV